MSWSKENPLGTHCSMVCLHGRGPLCPPQSTTCGTLFFTVAVNTLSQLVRRCEVRGYFRKTQPCFPLREGLSIAVDPTLSQLGPRQDTPLFLISALSHALTSDRGYCTSSLLAFSLQPAMCSPFHLALSLAVSGASVCSFVQCGK